MTFTLFQPNKKAKSAEVNANFAFVSGDRLIAIDPYIGEPKGTFEIGDLTATTNGSLVGDLNARTGSFLNVHNSSGTLINRVSYDDLLNLQSATQTQEGTVRLLTNAQTAQGTNTGRAMTAPNLLSLFGLSTDSANGTAKLPINIGGSFKTLIFQWGVSATAIDISGGGTTVTLTFNEAFPNIPVAYSGGILGVAPNYAPDCFATIRDIPTTTQIQVRLDETGSTQSAKATYWAIGIS